MTWLPTVAEASGYRRTSRHAEVLEFIRCLKPRAPGMRVLDMGASGLGQPMPALLLTDLRRPTPARAHASGRPVVMVVANIHAGEVEGKEMLLALARDITTGPLGRFLRRSVLLLVPDYNPDGNDRIDVRNRALDLKHLCGQVGPEGGVGTRQTGQGLNLNKDYMKQEAVETRNLSRLFGRWRPHLFVDCHTTDGSIHGYDLTFDCPNAVESGPKGPMRYVHDRLLPAVSASLRRRTGHRTFFYGNFRDPKDPMKGWESYSPLPRFGSDYRGLTGRMDILLEAYSYIPFKARCRVTYDILVEILDYASVHGAEVRRVVREAEDETTARGRAPRPDDRVAVHYGEPARDPAGRLSFRYSAHPLSEFSCEAWDLASQRARRVPGRRRRRYRIPHYGTFLPTRTVRRPLAYLVPAVERRVLDLLRGHNLRLVRLRRPRALEVERYVVLGRERIVSHDVSSFRRRWETVLWCRSEGGGHLARPGDWLLPMAQPLANVAIYLLEPESDDGCVRWGHFDRLRRGDAYPVLRVLP